MESKRPVSKQGVRSKYLAHRDSLSKKEREEKSRKIWDNLKEQKEFRDAEIILVYMDYRSEVMTTGLVEELLHSGSGKRVFAPRVEGMDIAFYEIHEMEELMPGYQGIREPLENEKRLFTVHRMQAHKCFLLVPGAVFDRELSRMGYGKGFYDRFLERFSHMTKAGLAFDCQIAARIPTEAHDRRMDMVVTETEVIK